MTIDKSSCFPRISDKNTCSLKAVVNDKRIIIGDYTYYHDFKDPVDFEQNNVLYHYPVNDEKLVIGKFCSIASGAKFLFNGGNHKNESFANYPFAIFPDLWPVGLRINDCWDNKGDIIIGNDVWIGFEALIMAGVTISDGARIGSRSVVTKDVGPYEVVGGIPAKLIKKRFDDDTIELLLKLRWWDLDEATIMENITTLINADKEALKELVQKL